LYKLLDFATLSVYNVKSKDRGAVIISNVVTVRKRPHERDNCRNRNRFFGRLRLVYDEIHRVLSQFVEGYHRFLASKGCGTPQPFYFSLHKFEEDYL
jgi:hypothetical protein